MTEHVQLELIAAIVIVAGQIITAWKANTAAVHARNADQNAVKANQVAVVASAQNVRAIEQVHEAVNGGMASQRAEIADLKIQLKIAKALPAEEPAPVPVMPVQIVNTQPIPVTQTPEERLEEIRGSQ